MSILSNVSMTSAPDTHYSFLSLIPVAIIGATRFYTTLVNVLSA